MDTFDRIQKLMENEQLKQADLARICGARSSSVSDWFKGKSTSYLKYIDKIADYFGVTVDYLINGEKESNGESSKNEFETQTKEEKELLVLYRKTADMPDEYREKMFNTIKDTIDIYLKAIGEGDKN